ncbi:MAG: DUF499 domain-containing protein [Anaerolineae bacterium]|nr:DUF499 domain-containing protein [Anaerolineae bacterium]MDW8172682.1 DUF499 domain-containing protein [Anaerolineae bacterium]
MIDYEAKLREARQLIDRGQYSLALMVLGGLLEALYTDFYADLLRAMPAQQRQEISRREQDFVSGDRNARDKSFAGITLGGKSKFLYDNRLFEEGERLLGRPLSQLRAFDPRPFIAARNQAAHEAQAEVNEDEAELYYRQMRVLLQELDYLKKAQPVAEINVGALKSWKDNGVIPHDDILSGNLQMDTYAADLWGVARNDPHTPAVYREPRAFFQQTYLTASLRSLLSDVLKVLSGQGGDRVLQLRTPFGGGKTHSLIALYHVAKHRSALGDWAAQLPPLGDCAVAAVQCEKFSVLQGRKTPDGLHIRTLWGEIAYQLGGADAYARLLAEDQNYTAPGGETLAALLRDFQQPVLILLDEVLNHVEAAQTFQVGNSTLGRQLMLFLKNLTEAVSASRHAALVYSLQASVRESVGAESLLDTLDHLVSRLDAKREPVSGSDVMRVVQCRLFQHLGDGDMRRSVAQAYADAYRRAQVGIGLSPSEQQQVAQEAQRLAQRIEDSYPFHPDLLDVMYHRWGTLPSYQRTRGALQFLASAIYDLWHEGRDLQPLIGVGDVLLDMDNTRNAFFTQVGRREQYHAALDADIIGPDARARRVDREIAAQNPGYQRFRLGTRLATAILLYSFGARDGEDRGVAEAELLRVALVPGLDSLPLKAALSDLRKELLYLHYTGQRYRFETQPNLNKLIDDEARKYTSEEVLQRVRTVLEGLLRGVEGVVLWPQTHSQVNDRLPLLQVAYLPLLLDWLEADNLETTLSQWLEFCGGARRVYKNALVLALPGYMARDSIRALAREAMAIEALQRERARHSFHDEQIAELKQRGDEVKERLSRAALVLYDRLAVPVPAPVGGPRPYTWRILELQSRNEETPHGRIVGVLEEARLLFHSLTPDKLIQLMRLDDAEVQMTAYARDCFFSHLDFPRLSRELVVAQAIARGVSEGKLGYTAVWQQEGGHYHFPNTTLLYLGRSLDASEVDLEDGLLIAARRASALVAPPASAVAAESLTTPVINAASQAPPTFSPTPSGPAQRYHLRVATDKGHLFKLVRVLQSLADKAEGLTIRVEVQAEHSGGFDTVWMRNAVEEPLDEADIDFRAQWD